MVIVGLAPRVGYEITDGSERQGYEPVRRHRRLVQMPDQHGETSYHQDMTLLRKALSRAKDLWLCVFGDVRKRPPPGGGDSAK